jgi:hypothetical protein
MIMTEEKKQTWQNILLFLAFEWFGKEFVEEFMNYKYDGDPIQEGETKINCDLDEHEKVFWDFVDALFNHLRKNRKKMPAGELEEKKRIAVGLKSQFWGMIQLNHPEFMEPDNIGIRQGYVIVESPPMATNPLVEIFKGMPSG